MEDFERSQKYGHTDLGAGENRKTCKSYIERKKKDELIGFWDNNAINLSPENSGSSVCRPEEVADLRYDQI